jgi:flagellar FliL protein
MAQALAAKAAAAEDTEETAASAEGDAPKKRKLLSGKRLVIGVAAIGVLAVGAYMSGMLDSIMGGAPAEGEHAAAEEAPSAIYYDLPDMLVNLSSADGRSSFLKLTISLEIEDGVSVDELEKLLPRIIDNFQVYLRELRPEDLSGSAGIYRLKEELLARVNTAVYPVVVRDVLFKEMLVQ